MTKYRNILKLDFPNFSVVLTRVIVHTTVYYYDPKIKCSCGLWGCFEELLTDLSKAFGCIPNDLIIVQIAAYGFDNNSLKRIRNHLSNRKQKVKVNGAYRIIMERYILWCSARLYI